MTHCILIRMLRETMFSELAKWSIEFKNVKAGDEVLICVSPDTDTTRYSALVTHLKGIDAIPHVMVVNLHARGVDAPHICRVIRSLEEFQAMKIVRQLRNKSMGRGRFPYKLVLASRHSNSRPLDYQSSALNQLGHRPLPLRHAPGGIFSCAVSKYLQHSV